MRERARRQRMLSLVVHDLRTPLSTLAMVTARLKSKPHVAELASSEIEMFARNVSRIERMLRNVIDTSHFEDGPLTLDREPCDLGRLAEEAVAGLGATGKNRAISVERCDDDLVVMGDSLRLREVLDQLLSNAVRFTPASGAILVCVSRTAREVIVAVADTGIGIAPERIDSLFVAPWDTSDAKPKMGLYLAQGLVHAHGGRLMVESVLDQGSTFSFAVPRAATTS